MLALFVALSLSQAGPCVDGGVCQFSNDTDTTLKVLGTVAAFGNFAAQHFVPAFAPPPSVWLESINAFDGGPLGNAMDGGLALATGSTDQAGAIIAQQGYNGGWTVLKLPLLCFEPGSDVGPGYRCNFWPANQFSVAGDFHAYWMMDGGMWDAGSPRPDFCFALTASDSFPANGYDGGGWIWSYICGGG